jgi:hypothetical protein
LYKSTALVHCIGAGRADQMIPIECDESLSTHRSQQQSSKDAFVELDVEPPTSSLVKIDNNREVGSSSTLARTKLGHLSPEARTIINGAIGGR